MNPSQIPTWRAATRVSYGRASPGPRYLRLVCLTLTIWLGAIGAALADEPSYESWPEIDLWLRLSPEWRLSMFVPLSKNIETKYREGSLILQADYAWGKESRLYKARLLDENREREIYNWLVRGGYLAGRSLDDHGETYRENTMFLELHNRTPLIGDVLLSHRLRTDLRWLGDPPEFSFRGRYRLMIEKEFKAGDTSIVPYANIEPYYDSRSSVTNLYALNVILHLYFETGGAR